MAIRKQKTNYLQLNFSGKVPEFSGIFVKFS
jgi:hypothetical protein